MGQFEEMETILLKLTHIIEAEEEILDYLFRL